MKNSITPNQIKVNNRNLIYQYLYEHKRVSQQDICFELRLSRPTVTNKLNELEAEGLIKKEGQIDSEFVGRKAAAYTICADYRVGIGVEILKREIKMIAIDLYGEKIDRLVCKLTYEMTDSYYHAVSEKILSFIDSLNLNKEQILGIGFAMQGLISPDNRTVVYGKILSCTGLTIDVFEKYLPYPCAFFHDSACAANAELWSTPELQNAFYLSVSNHLGAAVISQGSILSGKHGHTGTVEHIKIRPNGKECYCGQRGCIETLCSLHALLEEGEDPDDFFARVRSGEADAEKRWITFLNHLAEAINLLHLVHDVDFILGGYLAPYLEDRDIAYLYEEIKKGTAFEEDSDFIHVSRMPKHNIAIGAALTYVKAYMDSDLLD